MSDQKDNEATKKELQEARQIRRNKVEYDALAAIFQTQPDRNEHPREIISIATGTGSLTMLMSEIGS